MRSDIDIVGYSRKTGKSSKTGNEYDFVEVSFLTDDRFTNGRKAFTAICNYDVVANVLTDNRIDLLMDGHSITADCVYHFQNGRVVIDAFL